MPEYELTTDPDLAPRWAKLAADEQAHTLIGNRATDAAIKTHARETAAELRAEREQLEDEIATAARVITVERLDPKVWGRLVAEHPIRPGDPYDARMGFNTDTFDSALMPAAITSVTDGAGHPVEWGWDALVEAMSPGQFEQIMGETLRLHTEREAVPFSLADYRSRRASAPSSK